MQDGMPKTLRQTPGPGLDRDPTTGSSLLSDGIYSHVRKAIVRGDLRPNQRLIEAELAEQTHASRTPVRQTLQRLALEGLVVRRRSGWVVREHSVAEIRAIYEVRGALEGYAAFLAAARATPEEVSVLENLYPEGDDTVSMPPAAQVDLNERFHDGVIGAARNDRLSALCRESRQYYFNYRIARIYTYDDTRRSIEGHRRIVAALAARDSGAAEASARAHVADALEIVLTKLA
jgi:DNA-binding GntR family transcriptional regulator